MSIISFQFRYRGRNREVIQGSVMRKQWTVALAAVLAAAMAAPGARGQGFPFEDAFTAYQPGSTGAPAWSILGGAFTTQEGALRGPVAIRYNARMPQRFVADMTLDLRGSSADRPLGAPATEAALFFNHQNDGDTRSSDIVLLHPAAQAGKLEVVTATDRPGLPRDTHETRTADVPDGPVALKVIVDAAAGRFSVMLGGQPVLTSAPMEYAGGLLAIRLSEGASLDRVVLRTPTTEESRSVLLTRLFNDPRDVAGVGGDILVLHRGSPAVLTVTPDGEVTRTFGRRAPGGIPDPVALDRGPKGEVMVLNRIPGEVVVFERDGGIRSRFGAGRLKEPIDFAVMPDGTVYVADPGARAVAVFSADQRYLGSLNMPVNLTGVPVRLADDPFANLAVAFRDPDRVAVLRPGPDHVSSALVSEADATVSDLVSIEGRTLAYLDDAIVEWPQSAGAQAFRASAAGGLKAGGRLGLVNGSVYAVDRANSRLVAVPDTLAEPKPSVSFLNIAQTAALVRWTSTVPALESRVRVTWGGRSSVERQKNKEPALEHQVPVSNLKEGYDVLYAVSPTVATIPPMDWSVDYPLKAEAPASTAPDATRTAPATGPTGAEGTSQGNAPAQPAVEAAP